jgi:hypothetical protein
VNIFHMITDHVLRPKSLSWPQVSSLVLTYSGISFGIIISIVSNQATCAEFTPGNLLLSQSDILREYTRDGVLVQSISIPYPGGAPCPQCEEARDVTVHPNGRAYVYNGTSKPYLSEFNPITDGWSHQTFAGLSLVNNGSYGGLTTRGRYAFLPDMRTFGDGGEPMGIIRFDLEGGPAIRFAEDIGPIDLNIGLDGLLYALHPGGSPSGRDVDVFNPESTTRLRTIDVGRTDNRGVAADSDGSLFVVSWNETLYHFDPNGLLLGSLNLPASDTFDIDINNDGAIVVGSRFGVIMLTDRQFANVSSFTSPGGEVFVSFLPIPEPSATLTAVVLIGILSGCRVPKKQRL